MFTMINEFSSWRNITKRYKQLLIAGAPKGSVYGSYLAGKSSAYNSSQVLFRVQSGESAWD